MTVSDREFFESLYRAHYGAVLRHALRQLDPASAEDVAAETFTIAWRRLDEVPAEPLPWLLVCARNLIANARRSARRADEKTRAARAMSPLATTDFATGVVERDLLMRAFAALRETERETLALIAWDGLSHDEAARVLGTSRVAFAMRLSRARRRLARALDALQPTPCLHPRIQEHPS